MRLTGIVHPRSIAALFVLIICVRQSPALRGEALFDENVRVVHAEQMDYSPIAHIVAPKGAVVVIGVSLTKTGAVVSASPISGPKGLIDECVKNAKMWEFDASKSSEAVIVYVFQVSGLCARCQGTSAYYPPNLLVISSGERIVSK